MKHNETPESRLVWWSVGAVLIMHTITNDIWVALTGCYVVQFLTAFLEQSFLQHETPSLSQ